MWPYLWEGAQDLSTLVTSDFKRKDKEGLRGASRAARTAANATVSKVEIVKVEDLRDLPQLRLQERFPHLASVSLKGYSKDPIPFQQFTWDTMSKMPNLTSVNLSGCNESAVGSWAACAALAQCSQLEELILPGGGEMQHAALGALAQLTRLTHLTMKGKYHLDAKGIQQLSTLQQLQHLNLHDCEDVPDQAVAYLAQLKALTALDLSYCGPVWGSTLGQLATISGLLKLNLSESQYLTTIKGLELLPALQDLRLTPLYELEPEDVAPLSALTTLTSLAVDMDITDEYIALLRLPSLASLTVQAITLTALPAVGVLHQLTHLEVSSSDSLSHVLPLPRLEDLDIWSVQDYSSLIDDVDEPADLVAAIARQTSLTRLVLRTHFSSVSLSEQQMQQMVAPLKKLQSFTAPFHTDETSCLAACAALAELPLLRQLKLEDVPQPAHLAMLVRCVGLEVLDVWWREGVSGASTGLLAALVCKPGMRRLCYPRRDDATIDGEVLVQIAAWAAVELA